MTDHSIILASSSPQRRKILADLGITFDVVPSSIDESSCLENDPKRRSEILALMKADDVASKYPDHWVLGCDTLVVAPNGTLLEKPVDESDARRMLKLQSGGSSTVHSAVCLMRNNVRHEGVSSSLVTFKKLTAKDIDWWISTKLWDGRSGAFQIDGPGQLMIEKLEGDFSGVVGLPVFLLGKLLEEAGIE